MQAIVGIEWDDGNREHCQKHGVTLAEAEEVLRGPLYRLPDRAHSHTEARLRAIGRTTSGRHVFAVYTVREREGALWLRPVSVRFMHKHEVETYEKAASAGVRE